MSASAVSGQDLKGGMDVHSRISDYPVMRGRLRTTRTYGAPFLLVLAYLFIDYGRPQDILPPLKALHPGMIVQLMLLIFLVTRGRLLSFDSPQVKFYFMLIVLATLHVPLAVNNFYAFMVWQTLALNYIVFLSLIYFVDNFFRMEKLINVWVMINAICAIIGIKSGGMVPGSAFMGDENDFALVMNMAIPFAYFLFLGSRSRKKRLIYMCAVGLFITGSVISLSRGGFLGLAAAFVFCWLLTPRKLIGTLVIALMVAVLALSAPETYMTEIQSIKNENIEEGTGAIRWYYWQRGWDMFLDNPVMGVGQGNFPWRIHDYEPPEGFHGRYHGGRAAHSLYVTLVSELGAIGATAFLGMLLYTFTGLIRLLRACRSRLRMPDENMGLSPDTRYALNMLQSISYGVFGSMFAFLVSSIFLTVLYYPHFYVLVALGIAVTRVGENIISDRNRRRVSNVMGSNTQRDMGAACRTS